MKSVSIIPAMQEVKAARRENKCFAPRGRAVRSAGNPRSATACPAVRPRPSPLPLVPSPLRGLYCPFTLPRFGEGTVLVFPPFLI